MFGCGASLPAVRLACDVCCVPSTTLVVLRIHLRHAPKFSIAIERARLVLDTVDIGIEGHLNACLESRQDAADTRVKPLPALASAQLGGTRFPRCYTEHSTESRHFGNQVQVRQIPASIRGPCSILAAVELRSY